MGIEVGSQPDGAATAPKVVLHDHLDGGLRPSTLHELADAAGYDAIPREAAALARFFDERAGGSLERYLAPFEHTIAVMQSVDAVMRVAYESVVDHAATGVVYAEVRIAPSLHQQAGMSREEAIEAALTGLGEGEADSGISARLIVSAMRDQADSVEVARAAAAFRDEGVVGFDLAGPEAGYPASGHAAAIDLAREEGLRVTIHAGEGAGVASIEDALDSGAERLGHGVRIVDDIAADRGFLRFGRTADRVRHGSVPLELCLKSEIDTRVVHSAAAHPIDLLDREGFVTTINTDNTLMSMTDMSNEFDLLSTHKGFTNHDFRRLTMNAIDAAFCDDATKEQIRSRVALGYEGLADT